MPVVSITLEDTNRTILSNVYFKIIEDIVDIIKIPRESVVVVHKDLELTLTDNRTNVSNLESSNIPSTYSKRRVIASITEDYNEDELTTTAVHQQYSYPIFRDGDIDVYVYPLYVKSDVTLEFNYLSPSKMEATRIRDDIRIRLSQTRNIFNHDVEYDILIPEVVEEFIADVHSLKSRLVPQSLETYFREHATKRVHLLTDMANKENTRIAVNEKQIRIVGLFDFSSMPEKLDTDNENNSYKISFSYKFSMDIPRAIVMRYPVMVCNKPLPAKYLEFIEANKIQSKEEYKRDLNYTNFGLYNLSHFEAHRQLENRVDIKLPVNIPLFDDFDVRGGHKGYAILTSFLTDIDETDKKSLFNLREIDPFYVNEDVLQFLVDGEREYAVNPYMSFLYFGLHQDGIHFDNNILEIDADLNIKSKIELSLFKPVRVTLSCILDITSLPIEAIDRLLGNDKMILVFISEYLRVYRDFKTEFSRSNIPDNSFYKTFVYITYSYLKEDKIDILRSIYEVVRSDRYIYLNLLSILYNNYPGIFRSLSKNEIVDVQDVRTKLNVGYTDHEYSIMRTVMTNYIVGLKRSELDDEKMV